jgi:hypothetical protein
MVLAAYLMLAVEPFHADAQTDQPGGRRELLVRGGMLTLGGWATANIFAGAAGASFSEDAAAYGFWQMNALWNSVNLALAGGTLLTRGPQPAEHGSAAFSLPAYRAESHRFEKILLFNAGVDVGYMIAGAWMWERGSRGRGLNAGGVSADRLTGWGQALVLQGAFLFVFDLVLARRIAADREATERAVPPRRVTTDG